MCRLVLCNGFELLVLYELQLKCMHLACREHREVLSLPQAQNRAAAKRNAEPGRPKYQHLSHGLVLSPRCFSLLFATATSLPPGLRASLWLLTHVLPVCARLCKLAAAATSALIHA